MRGSSLLTLLILLAFCSRSAAQDASKLKDTIVKATEFSIPRSGAFTLLGNNPANVSTPGFTKDIKLDYFLDKFSLKPNIAFEFQPVWLLGYKNMSLDNYKSKSKNPDLLRLLSRASVSIGTTSANDVNKLAYSLKLTFAKDPMLDTSYINSIQKILNKSVTDREAEESVLSKKKKKLSNQNLDLTDSIKSTNDRNLGLGRKLAIETNEDRKIQLQTLIQLNKNSIETFKSKIENNQKDSLQISTNLKGGDLAFNEKLRSEVTEAAKKYTEANWYKPKMDVGIGAVNTYKNASLTQLGIKQNGFGIWINPSVGFNPSDKKDTTTQTVSKVILTGLFKYINSPNDASQNFIGGNIRYGSMKINLFAEYTYLKEGQIKTNSIAYGGSYTIGSKKIIEFGIRTDYDKGFTFKSLMPVIAFDWKLANDIFNK